MKQSLLSSISNVSRCVGASLVSMTLVLGSIYAAPALGDTPSAKAEMPSLILPDFTRLVDKVGPAVVNIRTTAVIQVRGGIPGVDNNTAQLFQRFFGIPLPQNNVPQEQRKTEVGSGFIMSQDGYILTNAHVVKGAQAIYVTLTDKHEYKGKLIGLDERTDIALLKIDAKQLPTVALGDSKKVRVGEWVLAIGSPFNLDNTVTAGIVSAKSRDTGSYLPFIQTDVALNPGNSGGPLINMRGEVIGVNNMIMTKTGTFAGISFAIPIDEAMRIAEQLKKTGKVIHGRIGVSVGEVTKEVSDSLGLPRAYGAMIAGIEPESPAAKSGLQVGDIVLKAGTQTVERAADFARVIGEATPGSRLALEVWRKGGTQNLTVVVAQEKSQASSDVTDQPVLGLSVRDLTDDERKKLQLPKMGVLVVTTQGSVAQAGIRAGDVILRVDNVDISSVKQFDSLEKIIHGKKVIPILVQRGNTTQYIPVQPEAGTQK